MSINVGYLNGNYQYNSFRNNNTLTLNSFNDSNIMLLNCDGNSTADVLINHKNIYKTGISSNEYVIQDVTHTSNLMSIDEFSIKFNKTVNISDDIKVKNLLATSNNTVMISSNVQINLIDANDSLTISAKHSNSKIHMTTNNFLIKDLNNSNRISMNDHKIDFSKDIYINNGTLYVDAISGISSALLIENAKYTSTTTDKFTAEQNLSILNTSSSPDITSLFITKKNGLANIISVNTCNLGTMTNVLTLNNNGLLGIGTSKPDATISISKVNSNIISYQGSNTDDIFKLTQYADVGIGTTKPLGQLHIKRIDDTTNEKKRRNPMINIDMNYNEVNNYSNIYTTYTTKFTGGVSATTNTVMKLYCKTEQINDNITNNFYLLNADIYSKMSNNLENITTVSLPSMANIQFNSDNINIQFKLQNTLTYPSSDTIYIQKSTESIDTVNNRYYYTFIMMSKSTYSSGGYISDTTSVGYNSSNFLQDNTSLLLFDQVVSSSIDNVKCTINFIVEKNIIIANDRYVDYPFQYVHTTRALIPPPYLMYMSSNNAFVSSMSSYGTLSLGQQSPSSNYLLYAPGTAVINRLNVKEFNTENINSNISFMNANLINIKDLKCGKLTSESVEVTNIINSNIVCQIGNFSNLASTQLNFQNCSNSYLKFTNSNIQFKTKLSIGNADFLQFDNSSCEIKVGPEIVAINPNATAFFNRSNGLLVTNLNDTSTINPSISIQTSNTLSSPYLNMKNGASDYNFRLLLDVNQKNRFQLTNNKLNSTQISYFGTNKRAPSIIQHVNESNVLSFGNQNVFCIDCENKASLYTGSESYTYTNYSSKVSVGVPYLKLSSDGINEKDYLDYFQSYINTTEREYLMNIFGNVCISDIADNPVLTTKIINGKVATAINSQPIANQTLTVNGNIYSSNITVYDDIIMNIGGEQRSLKTILQSGSLI